MPALPWLAAAALITGQLAPTTAPPAAPPTSPTSPTSTTTPAAAPADIGSIIDASRQLVVVKTGSWDDRVGRAQRYAKGDAGWQPVGPAIDIVVGTGGLGWGIGLHGGGVGISDPRKVEGDGRAPAGVFALTRAFGKLSAPVSGLPSHQLVPGDVCVDDATHPAYNTILGKGDAAAAPTWKSAEQMVRKDWLYDLVVVVDQNHGGREVVTATPGPVAGRGSCVFLHVWRREKSGTAGCTAMEKAHLEDLIRWLNATDSPLLVQLPRDVYARVRGTWHLP